MFYESLVRPLLFTLDPEVAHRSAIRFGHWVSRWGRVRRLVRGIYDLQFPQLAVTAFGLHFRNPVGLAAGFDKHGEVHSLLADLGFGHVEIGSVSLRPWPGNPSPTLLRLPRDRGLINRLGLNSVGAEVVGARLREANAGVPIGINLVKTADPKISGPAGVDDFVQNFAMLYDAADYITLNLSCPNTPDGQTFEEPEALGRLLKRLREKEAELKCGTGRKPLLVKLSPDLDDAALDRLLAVSEQHAISGYVISNTTVRREGLRTAPSTLEAFGAGGLSGLPLTQYAQAMVRKVWKKTGGRRPIIAVGGIGCDPEKHPGEVVWEYLQSGATLVQLHTGLIYSGPAVVKRINARLVEILRRNNVSSLEEYFARRKTETPR